MTGGRRGLDWEPEIGDWDELEPEPEPGERLVRSGGQGLMMLVNTGASARPGQGCRAQGVRSPGVLGRHTGTETMDTYSSFVSFFKLTSNY